MRFFYFIILVAFIALQAKPQGKITIQGDPNIETILAKHVSFNENVKGFPGYRIQIFFESGNYSKNKAFGEKSKFISRYPDVAAYVIFQEPYYKVRVGNFRNKLEAEAFKMKIIDQWSEAYIVKDDIDLPGIITLEKK